MSVPFCITHLRPPRGFATVLEGLAREVLRDQPEDIPKYAAQHFRALLKQREDSGMDPAEWAAKLEDMYHNNAFKAPGAIPEKYPATQVMTSNEQSKGHLTEDESSKQATRSEEVDFTASTEEKEDITEKHIILPEKGISEEETVPILPAVDGQPDCLNRIEEKDPTTNTFDQVVWAANGKDSSSASDQDMSQSELEPTDALSLRAIKNVDVCAQESEMAGDEGADQQETVEVDEEIVNSEGLKNSDTEAQAEVLPCAAQADVNVCATQGATAEDEEDSLNPQPEDTVEQSSFQSPDRDQHEEKEKAEETDTEASPGEIIKGSSHCRGALNNNALPEEDSLVGISFHDVPEDQQINEVEEEGSVEVSQDNALEMHPEDKSKEVTKSEENPQDETDQNEHNEKMIKSEYHQNEDSDKEAESNNLCYKEDETAGMVGGDEADIRTEGHGEVEDHLFRVTRSNVSAAAAERETLEASAQHLLEENEEGQRTPAEPQPENAVVENEVKSKEISSKEKGLVGNVDSQIEKKHDPMCDEGSRLITTESADWPAASDQGEEQTLETVGDKEECSRPQEEEDIMDIPLDDPEANRAAAKIQAGFRGHMTRKKMKPEDKAEGEEVSSTGDVLNGSEGDAETGGSGAVERDDTSVPEQL